ncbi:hypothetical protein CNMCM7691_006338 [Aspergillus felis]|uniref:Uncharacterized protein n=1 Tax=Aspergillus felis TaxID=1287682 RepID=A0A8H6VB68_9EURO|nr:hypothetical protein CNMCM7691_006338 [Aspergillus felis]
MPYYAYFWSKKPGGNDLNNNYLLISPDRNTADTLFRLLDENRSFPVVTAPPPKIVNIKELNRESSRVWTYDCDDDELPYRLTKLLSGTYPDIYSKVPAFRDLLGKIKCVQMHLYPGTTNIGWKIPPELHMDSDDDCLSGYSFYVRRRGFPDVYWYNNVGIISLSQHKRSRFIVTVHTKLRSPKIPIIARDKVKVQWVDVDSTRRSLDISNGFLALDLGKTKLFHFSDFLQRFSIMYNDSSESSNPYVDSKIAWSSESGNNNDGFELCEGVPVGELGDMSEDEY